MSFSQTPRSPSPPALEAQPFDQASELLSLHNQEIPQAQEVGQASPPLDTSKSQVEEMARTNFLWKNIKYVSLVVLVAQNTALVLTMRYSRIVTGGKKLYLASTAVVLNELLKFCISLLMLFYTSGFDIKRTGKLLYVEIIEKAVGTLKVSVPSVLYTIQNNLLYVAISRLNAATFQVSTKYSAGCVLFEWVFLPTLTSSSGNVPTEDPHYSTVLCYFIEEDVERPSVVLSCCFNGCSGISAG
jgi:hypothetical protein